MGVLESYSLETEKTGDGASVKEHEVELPEQMLEE